MGILGLTSQAALDEAHALLANAGTELVTLKAQLAERTAQRDGLESRMETLEGNLARYRRDAASFEASYQKILGEHTACDEALRRATKAVAASEQRKAAVAQAAAQDALEGLQERLVAVQGALNEETASGKKLRWELARVREQLAAAESAKDAVAAELRKVRLECEEQLRAAREAHRARIELYEKAHGTSPERNA